MNDFIIMKNPGEDVEFNLVEALSTIGPHVWIKPFSEDGGDFETTLTSALAYAGNEPVRLVVDLVGANLFTAQSPLFSMLTTRKIAGHEIPQGSSIILLTEKDQHSFSGDHATMNLIANKLNVFDLTTAPEVKQSQAPSLMNLMDEMDGPHKKDMQMLASMIMHSYGPDFKPKTNIILNFGGQGKTKAMEAMIPEGAKTYVVGRNADMESVSQEVVKPRIGRVFDDSSDKGM